MPAIFLPADVPALIHYLQHAALAIVASQPAEALRLALVASELRQAVAR